MYLMTLYMSLAAKYALWCCKTRREVFTDFANCTELSNDYITGVDLTSPQTSYRTEEAIVNISTLVLNEQLLLVFALKAYDHNNQSSETSNVVVVSWVKTKPTPTPTPVAPPGNMLKLILSCSIVGFVVLITFVVLVLYKSYRRRPKASDPSPPNEPVGLDTIRVGHEAPVYETPTIKDNVYVNPPQNGRDDEPVEANYLDSTRLGYRVPVHGRAPNTQRKPYPQYNDHSWSSSYIYYQ
jgi:hypothetical protein